MRYCHGFNPALAGVLCVLIISGCAGTQNGQMSPVVDRGAQTSEPQAYPVPREPIAAVPQPVAPQPAVPRQTKAEPPAVVALLDHAEQQANAGDLESAAATLERAIRIDSRNPVLWHHLASVRLAEAEPAQAEQLATKSNSLAAGNHPLQARNWELIAQARRSRGDMAGARSAEQQARGLVSR